MIFVPTRIDDDRPWAAAAARTGPGDSVGRCCVRVAAPPRPKPGFKARHGNGMPRLLGATPARGLPPSFDLGKEVRPSDSRLGRTRRAHGGAESSRALRLPAARRRSGSRPCRLRRESRPSTRKELFSGASCLPASACKARANLKGSEGGILRARHPGLRTSESAGCGEPSLLSRGSSASESGPDTDPQKSGAFGLCLCLCLSTSLASL
jgi:hypothetical protein